MTVLVPAALLGFTAPHAGALSCVTQAQFTTAQRAELASATVKLAALAASGDANGLRAATIPEVAAHFDGIAGTVTPLAGPLHGAKIVTENLYLLHAEDLKPGSDDQAQFFCSSQFPSLLVTLTIPGLPPGTYALSLVHAEGIAAPQQMGLVLAHGAQGWQLAGFFARPLTMGGHDGLWYWTKARQLKTAGSPWSAFFYGQTARFLLTPVDFLSSPNLEKLDHETADTRPSGLPAEGAPMLLQSGTQSYSITSLQTEGIAGGLDLAIYYKPAATDPAAQRQEALQLMRALLSAHPDLKTNFHGLWAHAGFPGQPGFALEQAMDAITPGP